MTSQDQVEQQADELAMRAASSVWREAQTAGRASECIKQAIPLTEMLACVEALRVANEMFFLLDEHVNALAAFDAAMKKGQS